jgi:hypothetical protein
MMRFDFFTFKKKVFRTSTVALVFITTIIGACGGIELRQKPLSEYQAFADSITKVAQNTLALNLAKAIETGGPADAVAFCNLHALPITDSLSRLYGCSIERLSNKNRNERSAFYDQRDGETFQMFLTSQAKDTIIADDQNVFYYKPIRMAMPICLSCHGTPNVIPQDVQQILKEKYPNDLAVGYALGDMRGLWKVTFDKPVQPNQ